MGGGGDFVLFVRYTWGGGGGFCPSQQKRVGGFCPGGGGVVRIPHKVSPVR